MIVTAFGDLGGTQPPLPGGGRAQQPLPGGVRAQPPFPGGGRAQPSIFEPKKMISNILLWLIAKKRLLSRWQRGLTWLFLLYGNRFDLNSKQGRI